MSADKRALDAAREQWLPTYLGPWWSGWSDGRRNAEAPLRDAFDAGWKAAHAGEDAASGGQHDEAALDRDDIDLASVMKRVDNGEADNDPRVVVLAREFIVDEARHAEWSDRD